MNKQILIVVILLLPMLIYSQGINFEKGSWEEVLAKSQQIDKPVFVDIFTSWCGPCKRMEREVFTQKEVGETYNNNFICYQIDAEKGEGVELAKKYKVAVYPTYLYIKPNGELFYKSTGFMPVTDFRKVSEMALADLNAPKSIEEWNKEYETKKNDPEFLRALYAEKRKNGLSNMALFEEYLKLIPIEDCLSDEVIALYRTEARNMTIDSYAFQYLLKYRNLFFSM